MLLQRKENEKMNDNPDLSILSDNVDKSQVNDPFVISYMHILITNVKKKSKKIK